ncbi:hypothetical protein D6783_00340 [Candidatus Woesearchaeota archaeon]|nr:MAG: hypothetical protein D6783_00340 [Candidatus Woesearchaeota archaeon]
MIFQDFIYQLQYLGIQDVLLPFILIFTITFAILQKINIFGDGKKNIHVVIAIVIGLAFITPHVLWGTGTDPSYPYLSNGMLDLVVVMNAALPKVSILLVAIIMGMLMLGIFGREVSIAGTSLAGWAVILTIAFVAWAFASSAGFFGPPGTPRFFGFYIDQELLTLLIIIAAFFLVIMYITKEDNNDPGKGLGKKLKDLMGEFGNVINK